MTHTFRPSWGSSPLARGLLTLILSSPGCGRIIPARAGFTGSPGEQSPAPMDHPRSRGVYSGRMRVMMTSPGSSPLARGLPACRGRSSACPRIIPARAGFTRQGSLRSPKPRDHPRSRGVYGSFRFCVPLTCGSSPLARGLLIAPVLAPSGRRIIPARAGFTGPAARDQGTARDHPRSRGVYYVYWRLNRG